MRGRPGTAAIIRRLANGNSSDEEASLESLEVIPAWSGRAFRQFLELPYSLYRDDPYWVPPLRVAQRQLFDREKHPFHKHATVQPFLALKDGEPAGRIAAIFDPNYNNFHQEQAGFFGFFETVEDERVSAALLEAARAWLAGRGSTVIRGPMNPSTNYECGLLVDGFDSSPQIMMPYNPPFYGPLIERAGLRKARDIYAYHIERTNFSGDKAFRIASRLNGGTKVNIRPIRMDAFNEDVEKVWHVYNSAWSRNWGFVPMTRDEFLFMAREMKAILQPELVLLGQVDGRTVGFALALPDINQALKRAGGRLLPLGLLKILYHKRSIRTLRVLVLGVVEEYRATGLAAAFYAELFHRAARLAYTSGEMSWVLEDNIMMNRSIEALGGSRYKTYRIYEWN